MHANEASNAYFSRPSSFRAMDATVGVAYGFSVFIACDRPMEPLMTALGTELIVEGDTVRAPATIPLPLITATGGEATTTLERQITMRKRRRR